MDKGLLLNLAIIAASRATDKFFRPLGDMPARSRTPHVPHRARQPRAHASSPNDGHWHMKYHRSRH